MQLADFYICEVQQDPHYFSNTDLWSLAGLQLESAFFSKNRDLIY